MNSLWAPHELDIVETLTRRVRVLSLDQIHDIWWPGNPCRKSVRRRLKRLRHADLLQRASINAHPRLNPSEPLQTWRPGESSPDFAEISNRARCRWIYESVPTEIYSATRLAANLYASSAIDVPPLLHRDHDLLMADVYVHYRGHRNDEASAWLGEDALPKAGFRIKDPDAFLVGLHGQIERVIESSGRYDAKRIRAFHNHCAKQSLSYELW